MMWATCHYDLGLTTDQFWSATPAQIWALTRRKEISEYLADRRSGIICAVVANVNRAKKSKSFTAEDFMPKYDFIKGKKQSPDALLAQFKTLIPAIEASVYNGRN